MLAIVLNAIKIRIEYYRLRIVYAQLDIIATTIIRFVKV